MVDRYPLSLKTITAKPFRTGFRQPIGVTRVKRHTQTYLYQLEVAPSYALEKSKSAQMKND